MEKQSMGLPRAEQLTLALRALYQRHGYRRYRMSNFESYDLYRENKTFLESEGIVTINDAHGRLLALKPDVTMSIVKNTKPEASSEKLYYMENVFRTAADGTLREISQMGLEYIGGADGYAEAEVVALAAQSLAAVGADFVLDISHMGFVTALLDALALPEALRPEMLAALRGKNAPALGALAAAAGCDEAACTALAGLPRLGGAFAQALPAACALAQNYPALQQPLEELTTLYTTLAAVGQAEYLRLDFSVLNHIDYYNGLVFKGYVKGVPRAVLAGGRYDNLLRCMGKPQAALGFALYLGELERALRTAPVCDVDILLLYTPAQNPALVMRAVQILLAQGGSVRAETAPPAGLRAKRVLRLQNNGGWEETTC